MKDGWVRLFTVPHKCRKLVRENHYDNEKWWETVLDTPQKKYIYQNARRRYEKTEDYLYLSNIKLTGEVGSAENIRWVQA